MMDNGMQIVICTQHNSLCAYESSSKIEVPVEEEREASVLTETLYTEKGF